MPPLRHAGAQAMEAAPRLWSRELLRIRTAPAYRGGTMGWLFRGGLRGQRADFLAEAGRQYARQVEGALHAKPDVRGAAEGALKADGHFGGDGAAAGNDVVKLLAGDTKAAGGGGNRKAKRFEIVAHQFAGMGRVFHWHAGSMNGGKRG